MSDGCVEALYIAPDACAPMSPVRTAELRAGIGIDGDRYARRAGTFSTWPQDHELTLIEAEVIEAVAAEHGVCFAPGETRRNITTRGVRLNTLVGRRFRVGAALCEGTRLCEPCAHLEIVTDKPGLVGQMAGRGGLRAVVLKGGAVRVGDTVTEEEASA